MWSMTSEPSTGGSYNASHIILLHNRPNEDDMCMINNSDATDDYEKNAAVDSDISSDDDDNNRNNGMRPLPSTDFSDAVRCGD